MLFYVHLIMEMFYILPSGSCLIVRTGTMPAEHNFKLNSDTVETAEYLILENIYTSSPRQEPLKQRELARIARTSLGMTNSILKRLTQKGWISIKKLNSRNIRYAITLEGLEEMLQRSYRYFKRTIDNISAYRDTIDGHIQNAAHRNFHTVLLIGLSDLDFIVEHSCSRYGLSFLKTSDKEYVFNATEHQILKVFSENIPAKDSVPQCLFLSDLIFKSQLMPIYIKE